MVRSSLDGYKHKSTSAFFPQNLGDLPPNVSRNHVAGLSHRDALFACSMLVLALMLDGRISQADWKFIQRAAGSARPPLEAKWSSTVSLVNMQLGESEHGIHIQYGRENLGKASQHGGMGRFSHVSFFPKSKSNLAYHFAV